MSAEPQRRRRLRRRRVSAQLPEVALGQLTPGGLAPAIMAIVERGVRQRPVLARAMVAEVELAFDEDYPPVRIVFGERIVLVEDGPAISPAVRIQGALPDLISLMVAPLVGGVPSPINARGRAAIGIVAARRVRFGGKLGLVRRFLAIVRV